MGYAFKPPLPQLQQGSPFVDRLVGAYTFHEGMGTAIYDHAGGDFHGTAQSYVEAAWVGSPYGHAFNLDGTADWINCGDIDDRDDISTSPDNVAHKHSTFALVSPSGSLGDFDGIASTRCNAAYYGGFHLHGESGDTVGYTQRQSGAWKTAGSTTTLTAGQWYAVCGTYDATNMNIYLDGILEASTASSYLTWSTASKPWSIGQWGVTGTKFWPGAIACVYWWFGRCLTHKEIAELSADPFLMFRPKNTWWEIMAATGGAAAPVTITHTLEIPANIRQTHSLDARISQTAALTANIRQTHSQDAELT